MYISEMEKALFGKEGFKDNEKYIKINTDFGTMIINKDRNIKKTIKITKEQAKGGIIKSITINYKSFCPKCNGINKEKCNKCKGNGFIIKEDVVNVKIPKKVKEGTNITIVGAGNQFVGDKERGNLIVKVHIFGKKVDKH